MNENEAIALERIAISAKALVETPRDQLMARASREDSLKQDLKLLSMIRTPPVILTEEDVVKRVIDEWNLPLECNDGDFEGYGPMAKDIVDALKESGFL